MGKLNNQVAIVTGAGGGFGEGIAQGEHRVGCAGAVKRPNRLFQNPFFAGLAFMYRKALGALLQRQAAQADGLHVRHQRRVQLLPQRLRHIGCATRARGLVLLRAGCATLKPAHGCL